MGDAMMGALSAAEKGVMNHTDDNLLAVADAMLQDMAHAASGGKNATENPFTAIDKMMGAMKDMQSGENGDGNPFAALSALAGTLGGAETGSRPVENESPFAI